MSVAAALTRLAPERVRRVVLGGAGPLELFEIWDLDAVRRFVTHGELPADPTIAAVLGAAIRAGADREALMARVQGVAGAPLDVPPDIPVLYVASGVAEVARARGSKFLELPGRGHIDALTSHEFKKASLDFLA